MPNEATSQTENLKALGFITDLAKRNLVIAFIAILLIFNALQYSKIQSDDKKHIAEIKDLRNENLKIQDKLIVFQNAIIVRYQYIEDKQREIDTEQLKADSDLQKLSKKIKEN